LGNETVSFFCLTFLGHLSVPLGSYMTHWDTGFSFDDPYGTQERDMLVSHGSYGVPCLKS
jgi:hypothetical protein